MKNKFDVENRVHRFYWDNDTNCATVTLCNLAEYFGIKIENQVIDAAAGLHGAGRFGAQCGLVEGTLMYIGIRGRDLKFKDEEIEKICFSFAENFIKKFGDLRCSVLRPGGFSESDPTHKCEDLTVRANNFSIEFIEESVLV